MEGEQMRAESDKRELDEGEKEVLGKGGVWIKRGSGQGLEEDLVG